MPPRGISRKFLRDFSQARSAHALKSFLPCQGLKPVPFEEFEEFTTPMREFFDMIARRPFELLGAAPRCFTREFENWFKLEPELFRLVNLKLYETEEAMLVRAEVPGFTEKELDVQVEPWKEKFNQIYRAVKFPCEVRPDDVKATLNNGVLELTLAKAKVVKKVHVEVKST